MMGRSPGLQDVTLPEDRWPKVAIIILNWNGWRDTIECINSVGEHPSSYLIVIDNGSTDDSREHLWKLLSDRFGPLLPHRASCGCFLTLGQVFEGRGVSLIFSSDNLGFSGGCNLGANWAFQHIKFDYLLLLNADARLAPGALDEALRVAATAGADLVGFLVRRPNDEHVVFAGSSCLGELFCSTYARRRVIHEISGPFRVVRTCMVSGCAMLLSHAVIESRLRAFGYLFDPRLFLYAEELDLCLWSCYNGFKAVVATRAIVYHDSGYGNLLKLCRAQYYLSRNLLWVGMRHTYGLVRCAFFIWHLLFRTLIAAKFVTKGYIKVSLEVLRGLRDGVCGLRSV